MKKTSAPHLSYLSCCLGLAGIMVSSYASAAGLTKLTKEIEDYKPVTQKRLNEANPKDWLLPKGNYEGWMFSELQQINKKNVKNVEVLDSIGATEVGPRISQCSLVADIFSSGATAKANGLRLIKDGRILDSSAALLVSKKSFKREEVKEVLKLLSK